MNKILVLLLSLTSFSLGQTSNVAVSYGNTGLTSIKYDGLEYLSVGRFGVNAVNFLNAAGQVLPGSTTGTVSFDSANRTTTMSFDWGSIKIAYAASANRLNIKITTANNSSQTLGGVYYEPLSIVLPSAPAEYDGVTPILGLNMGDPTALRLTSAQTVVILTNEDVTRPLLLGFPWSSNRPTSTAFPIRAQTAKDTMLPDSLPSVERPIPAGGTDTYELALRFGPASATTKSLVSDLYATFAGAFPFAQKWTDRRPIGQLIIGTTAAGFPKNPRGWFNDSSVDVTTPDGVAAFQKRLLAWADTSVNVMKKMNAQGMITWDIEGEQYSQPTTYICDPEKFTTLAPEMNGVIDQYFKKFTDSGFRVGVCVRPQDLIIPAGGGAPTQNTVADPTQILIKKIDYAYNRWGATMFYIDSNGDPNWPMDAAFFTSVHAKYPNVLLITEHENTRYYSVTAPYNELRTGVSGTSSSKLDVYPAAFSVIYTPDGDYGQYRNALQSSVLRGDILMFRAWYPDPQNDEVLKFYPPNGVAPPAPAFLKPVDGASVAGNVDMEVTVPDSSAPVASVRYVIDGDVAASHSVDAPPFNYTVDSSGWAAGIHSIQAIASDSIGDLGFANTNVFTGSSPVDPSPALSITAPVNGVSVSGSLTVKAQVNGSVPIVRTQFLVDGVEVMTGSAGGSVEFPWNTRTVGNGTHTLSITATDQKTRSATAAVAVIVSNLSPSISIATPTANAVVSGVIPILANVSSALAITGVQFAVDGSTVGDPVASSPYQASWNSRSVANGVHTISAVATDSAGNRSAASVSIRVANALGSGSLFGARTSPVDVQNLSAEGSEDWIHWGMHSPSSVERRGGASAQITTYSLSDNGTVLAYANNPFGFSWSNGAPDGNVSSTATGIYVSGQNNGFTFTAPADTAPRTLNVYVGVYKSRLAFSAKLSDGSAPTFVDTSVVNMDGQLSVKYSLTYQAASSGQKLRIIVFQLSGNTDPYSNITLQAATLQRGSAATGGLTGTP